MARLLKTLALVLVLALVTLSLLGWWFLHWDAIDAPELPGGVESGVVEYGGLQRHWFAYVPRAREPQPPILLLLHGSQGSGEAMRSMSYYSFDVQAERGGYIAVYPDGYEGHWNGCRASANYAANRQNIDDVGFLRALVTQLVARYGADPTRVYAAGYSNGGHMALRLALEAPDLVAGVASFAGSLPVQGNLGCSESGEPVSVLVVNGTADPVNPYAGGLVEILGDASRGEVRSSQATVEYFAALAGYDGPAEVRNWPDKAPDDGTSVRSTRWAQPGRDAVELITVQGGGHTIPHPVFSLPRIIGPTSHEFDAAEVVWQFFSEAGR